MPHAYHPQAAARLICWFPPDTGTVVVALFAADRLAQLAAVPVAAWELSLGVWLVVKGFKPTPITAAIDAASTPPAYQDVAV